MDGYWVKFQIHNKLDSNEIGLNHNWNVEKKIFVKNSLGLTEFPYWMYQRNSFWGEGRIGAQYRIIMPKNEITIIYDLIALNWHEIADNQQCRASNIDETNSKSAPDS